MAGLDGYAERRDAACTLERDRRARATLEDTRRTHESEAQSHRAAFQSLPGDTAVCARDVLIFRPHLSWNQAWLGAVRYDLYKGIARYRVCQGRDSAWHAKRFQGVVCRGR